MIQNGLYYATDELSDIVKASGGTWNDVKRRPIVCLIRSTENPDLYWAIPMGKLNHRNDEQIKRLHRYINLPEHDIRSCFYHIGRTTSKSIFFVSDAVPVIDRFIDCEHVGADGKHYIIKNVNLRNFEKITFQSW